MKKLLASVYLIGVHTLLVVVLLKTDFIDRVQYKFGISTPSELTSHYHRMLLYHKRMDDNVPSGAVIFIGDSITQSLCVSSVVSPSVNYGIGSDTTVGVIRRLQFYNSIKRAGTVVIAIGINDMKRRSNLQIRQNYLSILEQIPTTVPVVFSAILPVDEKLKEDRKGWNRDRIQQVNAAVADLADSSDRIFVVDAGPLLVDERGNLSEKYHVGDGIHLNSAGNAIWIGFLKKAIMKTRQGLSL